MRHLKWRALIQDAFLIQRPPEAGKQDFNTGKMVRCRGVLGKQTQEITET